MGNLNFKRLSRQMGVQTTTNMERINFKPHGKELDAEYYKRLLMQDRCYHHYKLPICVSITKKGTVKIIDKLRACNLHIYNDEEYPYIKFDGKKIKAHKIITECYTGEKIPENCNIHHINHIKYDFRPENLIVLPIALHDEIHRQEK